MYSVAAIKERELRYMLTKSKEHLNLVNETYWQHLRFAIRMALILQRAAIIAILHALLPAIFQTSVSSTICRLADEMRARKNAQKNH